MNQDEKPKTAEAFLDSLNLPITNSVTRIFWEDTLKQFADQQTSTQSKEIEALKKENKRLSKLVDSMERDVKWLRCLEGAGVDNWEGFDIAKDYMDEI